MAWMDALDPLYVVAFLCLFGLTIVVLAIAILLPRKKRDSLLRSLWRKWIIG